MTLRLPLALALVGLLTLSACDSGAGSDDITGTWSTTINYSVDTLLADHNSRIVADYTTTYTFELVNDDGLIYGRVSTGLEGMISHQEAGRAPVVEVLDSTNETIPTGQDVLFGTYDPPVLELDVPFGSYQENLWTFEKIGGRAELNGRIVHQWTFEKQFSTIPGPFPFIIEPDSDQTIAIRRDSDERPILEDPSTLVTGTPEVVQSYSDGRVVLNTIRVQED